MAPPPSTLDSPIVTVDVGPEPTTFAIYKGVLCHHSEFFRAALAGDFQEAQERKITLDEDDPEIFKIAYHWMYTGRVHHPSISIDPTTSQKTSGTASRILTDLWILGDKCGMAQLKNDVIDYFHNYTIQIKVGPSLQSISKIYSNTTPGAKLRQFVIESVADAGDLSGFIQASESSAVALPEECYQDIIKRLNQLRIDHVDVQASIQQWEDKDSSHWHEPVKQSASLASEKISKPFGDVEEQTEKE